MRKAQTAIEYLTLYGWAVLVIVLVGGVLYALGIFDPSAAWSYLTEKSFENQYIGIKDHKLTDEGTLEISLFSRGYDIIIESILIGSNEFEVDSIVTADKAETFSITSDMSGEKGEKYDYEIIINYLRLDTGITHIAEGVFTGFYEPEEYYEPEEAVVAEDYVYLSSFDEGTFYKTSGGNTVILAEKSEWWNKNWKKRIKITLTEEAGQNKYDHPVRISDISEYENIRIVNEDDEIPHQISNSDAWFLINITAGETKDYYLYYDSDTPPPVYDTTLNYSLNNEYLIVENNEIYVHVGNYNNPTSYGIDSFFNKKIRKDVSNYKTLFTNYDYSKTHSLEITEQGPVFIEFRISNATSSDTYRIFSKNNFIRKIINEDISTDEKICIGEENSEFDSFETNNHVQELMSDYESGITYSYARMLNSSDDYSLVMTSPVFLNKASFSSNPHKIGLTNYTLTFVPYYDFWLGRYDTDDCVYLAQNYESLKITKSDSEGVYEKNGYYTSKAYDTGQKSDFGEIKFSIDEQSSTEVKFRIRTGTTQEDVKTNIWRGSNSAYDYYTKNDDINNVHDGDRWIQFRAYLFTTNDENTPEFQAINITYSKE